MVSIPTVEQIVVSLFFIAPGFLATQVAIWFGVIEQEIPQGRLLGISMISSVLIDTLFLWGYQLSGGEIEGLSETQGIFFTPNFRPEFVLVLLVGSALLGFVYAIVIARDIPERIRNGLLSQGGVSRHPRQPWEGVLKTAHQVKVVTSDHEVLNGVVVEYSRAERERQLALSNVKWWDSDEHTWEEKDDDSVILFENDIHRLSVLTTTDGD